MAVKYNRSPVASVPAINNELQKIQVALEDAVSRKGDGPNQLEATVDANSQRIINLPEPVTNTEPVRKADFDDLGNKLRSDVYTAVRDAEDATDNANAAANTANSAANNANSAADNANIAADNAYKAIADLESDGYAVIDQIESDGESAIQALRVVNAGSFEDGATLTARNEVLYYLTEQTYYRWDGALPKTVPPASTPASTGGVGVGAWVDVGDAALRSELANSSKGAAIVARGVVAVDSIADLLALPEGQRKEGLRYLVKGYHAGSDVGGGEFYWSDSSAETSNSGTVFGSGATGRFKRVISGNVTVHWFGAVGDGVTDDTDALVAAMNYCISTGRALYLPAGTYLISSTINFEELDKSGIMITLIGEEGSYYRSDVAGKKPTVLLGASGLERMFYQPFGGAIRRCTFKNLFIQSQDPFDDTSVRAPLRAFDLYHAPYSVYENIGCIGITSLLHLRTCWLSKISKIKTNRTSQGVFIDGDDGAGGYGYADHVTVSDVAIGGYANDWGLRLRGVKSSSIRMIDVEQGYTGPGMLIEGCKQITVNNLYAENFDNAAPVMIQGIEGSPLDNLVDFSMNITIDGVHGNWNKAGIIVLRLGVVNVTIRNVRETRFDAPGRETHSGDWLRVSIGPMVQDLFLRIHSINLEGFSVSDKVFSDSRMTNEYGPIFRVNGNVLQHTSNRSYYGLTLERGTNYINTIHGTKQVVLTNGTLSSTVLSMTARTTAGSRKIEVTNTNGLVPGTFVTVGSQAGLFVTSVDRTNNEVWLGTEMESTASGVNVSYTEPTYI